MFSPSKPRQDRFGREFNQGLWAAYKDLGPNAKRAAHFALIILLVFILTGHRLEILIGTAGMAALLWGGLYNRTAPDDGLPTDNELRASDALREGDERDDYAASGAGVGTYEDVIHRLHTLVGHELSVQIRAGGPTGKPAALLSGPLRSALDVSQPGDDEVLFFAVGDEGDGFFLEFETFLFGDAAVHPLRAGFDITRRDGCVLTVLEPAADPA